MNKYDLGTTTQLSKSAAALGADAASQIQGSSVGGSGLFWKQKVGQS